MAKINDRIEVVDNDKLAFVSEIETQDLRDHSDYCADILNSGRNTSYGKDMTHVASVPIYLVQAFCNLKGITWQQFMMHGEFDKEFLEMAETRAFRTWAGRL